MWRIAQKIAEGSKLVTKWRKARQLAKEKSLEG